MTLTPVNGGDTISLGLPFLGFYGDWSAAPIFDTSVYDADESPAVYQTMLGLFGADGSGYYLGHTSTPRTTTALTRITSPCLTKRQTIM